MYFLYDNFYSFEEDLLNPSKIIMANNGQSEKIFFLWTKQVKGSFRSLRDLLLTSKDKWQVLEIVDTNQLASYEKIVQKEVACFAILNPTRYNFTSRELKQIWRIYALGCSLLVASGERDGDLDSGIDTSNLNDVILPFGVKFNDDCVIRPNLYKQYHPRDAMLEDFSANRGVSDTMNRLALTKVASSSIAELYNRKLGPKIIYSKGCTLSILNKSSTIAMTSSQWAIPTRQPICTFYKSTSVQGKPRARMIAFGSANLLTDHYINKEDNKCLVVTLLEFLKNPDFPINLSDAKTIEIPEYFVPPDADKLLDTPIGCLQECEPLPENKRKLLDLRLFNIDNRMSPLIGEAFEMFKMIREPLTLVKPELPFKYLSFEPATHGFPLRKIQSAEDSRLN